MSDDALIDAAAKAFRRGFGGVIRIIATDGGAFDVDGRASDAVIGPPIADPASAPAGADCIWRASRETLMRIFEGGRALDSAFLSGRLRISGDMSVMGRLEMESVR